MLNTFTTLVERDHDEMAAALDIIMSPSTSAAILREVVDELRLAFAVHALAEQRVLASLVKNRPSFAITEIARQSRYDHIEQQRTLAQLTSYVPGCRSWNKLVLELRGSMLRHALDAPGMILALDDAIAPLPDRELAGRFATERLRLLAETHPAQVETAS
jgi:hypothetical protein